jgi:hypothetical protein
MVEIDQEPPTTNLETYKIGDIFCSNDKEWVFQGDTSETPWEALRENEFIGKLDIQEISMTAELDEEIIKDKEEKIKIKKKYLPKKNIIYYEDNLSKDSYVTTTSSPPPLIKKKIFARLKQQFKKTI